MLLTHARARRGLCSDAAPRAEHPHPHIRPSGWPGPSRIPLSDQMSLPRRLPPPVSHDATSRGAVQVAPRSFLCVSSPPPQDASSREGTALSLLSAVSLHSQAQGLAGGVRPRWGREGSPVAPGLRASSSSSMGLGGGDLREAVRVGLGPISKATLVRFLLPRLVQLKGEALPSGHRQGLQALGGSQREDSRPDAGLTEPWSAVPSSRGKLKAHSAGRGDPYGGQSVRMEGRKDRWVRKQTSQLSQQEPGPHQWWAALSLCPDLGASCPGTQGALSGGHSLWRALSLSPRWTPGASIPPTWAVRGRRAPSSRWPLWPLMAGLSPVIVTASRCPWSLGRRSTAGPRSMVPESFPRGHEGGRSHHPAVASSGAYDHGVQGPERTL